MSTVPLATSGMRVAEVTGLYLTFRSGMPNFAFTASFAQFDREADRLQLVVEIRQGQRALPITDGEDAGLLDLFQSAFQVLCRGRCFRADEQAGRCDDRDCRLHVTPPTHWTRLKVPANTSFDLGGSGVD